MLLSELLEAEVVDEDGRVARPRPRRPGPSSSSAGHPKDTG